MTTDTALPRVCGRHRNYALAALRRERAIQLRASGMTFQAIADDIGYSSKATAYNVVRKAIREHVADSVEELVDYEVARLNSLQLAVWDKAMAGDIASGRIVMSIIMARIKVLGLDRADVATEKPRTVVIEPTVENLESFISGA